MLRSNPAEGSQVWCAASHELYRFDIQRESKVGPSLQFNEDVFAFDVGQDQIVVGGGFPGESAFLRKLRVGVGGMDVENVPAISSMFRDTVYDLSLSPDGKAVVVGSLDGTAAVLFLDEASRILSLNGHSGGITGVQWLSDREVMTSSRDGTIRTWGLASEVEPKRILNQHIGEVLAIARAPQGERESNALPIVASIGEDRTVRFWQPTIGRMMRFHRMVDDSPTAIAWEPSGRTLIVGTRGGKVLWIDSGTAAVLKETVVANETIFAVCVGDEGSLVMVGTAQGELRRVQSDD